MNFIKPIGFILLASLSSQCKNRTSSEIKAPALATNRQPLAFEDIAGHFVLSDRSLVKIEKDGTGRPPPVATTYF